MEKTIQGGINMKTVLKCFVIMVLALLVSGFLDWKDGDLQPITYWHRVERNQTFWEICTIYAPLDQKYKTMSEFLHETRKLNNGKIIYMPGEIVKIIVWQEKEGRITYGN